MAKKEKRRFIFNIIAYVIEAFVVCKIVNEYTGIIIKQVVILKKFNLLLILVCFLSIRAAQDLIIQIISVFLSNYMEVKPNEGLEITVIFILDSVLFTPIIEELVFRFAGVELLGKRLKSWLIVFWISVVFAGLHTYNIQGIFSMFVLSMILTLVYLYTRNLLYPITCHILYNASCMIDRSKI